MFGETRSGLSGSHDDNHEESEEAETEGEVIAKVSSKVNELGFTYPHTYTPHPPSSPPPPHTLTIGFLYSSCAP